ncbi:MAG: hypothetical protein ACRENX_02275, partial [Candidatus Dormibacteria bacterium]
MESPAYRTRLSGPELPYEWFADQYAQLVASRYPVIEVAHAFVLARAGGPAGCRLLDLGCGTGELRARADRQVDGALWRGGGTPGRVKPADWGAGLVARAMGHGWW